MNASIADQMRADLAEYELEKWCAAWIETFTVIAYFSQERIYAQQLEDTVNKLLGRVRALEIRLGRA